MAQSAAGNASRLSDAYGLSKTVLWWYLAYKLVIKSYLHLRARGLIGTAHGLYLDLARRIIRLVMLTPPAKRRVQRELAAANKELKKSLAPPSDVLETHISLPVQGRSPAWIGAELGRLKEMNAASWERGRVSGAVYHGHREDQVGEVIQDALQRFVLSNPLHPEVFPGVRRMDAEVVSMVLQMYNAPPDGVGTTTSGGTESILLACKAYRDWARTTRGITEPEMVIPISAHAAFDKASHYFNIKCHHIPVDPVSRKVRLDLVRRAINKNTIMLVGSAVNFGDGVADDIAALGALAARRGIGMHVDCCMGSFIVPFLERAGFPTLPFDFRVSGVTSISCDTHKYGFAPKGSSVIMYRNANWRKWQYFAKADWPGGVYASPTLAGSRPGALIAGAWAAMLAMGENGYIDSCRELVGARRRIEAGLHEIPGIEVLGQPVATIVAFQTSACDTYDVGDILSKQGWHLNALQMPASLHVCVTKPVAAVVDELLRDIRAAVDQATHKPSGKGQMAQIYGLGSSGVAGPGLVEEMCTLFCDALYVMPERDADTEGYIVAEEKPAAELPTV